MMKNWLSLILSCLVFTLVSAQSKFDHKEAFAPEFYPYPGSNFRSASGEPGPKYWQNRADYKITATLDTAIHQVSGLTIITYTNNSPDQLKFLWLQMDQNIYKKDSRATATTTEAGGRWANSLFTEGYKIKSVTIEYNGKTYTPKSIVTDTRMQLWLQETIKPGGGKVSISITFEFTIPQYGTDRMGRLNTRNGVIYEVAQWFPRMCVYDDIQGWNTMPYLGAGEFYCEYGNYDFSITAPSNLILVGSGELTNLTECYTPDQVSRWNAAKSSDQTVMIRTDKEVNDKRSRPSVSNITWKFRIENARDVAWAASRAFIQDAARINLPSGKKSLAISVYPVESIMKNGWQRSTEMVKGSVEHYSTKWYEYPYPAATNVAGIVGGMEYPGIVFCSSSASGSGLWGVTDHEFGHTWFPMIVGTNERKYAWMDEGFDTFINSLSTKAFKNGEFVDKGFTSDPNSPFMVKYTFGDKMDGLYHLPDVIQQENIGISAYSKPAQMLQALRTQVLGEERFDLAFREYIERWAFKHPTPWDFFHTMENVSGEDLSWFWRAWVLKEWKLDQAVKSVSYLQETPAGGAAITIESLEKMPMPVTVLVKETNGKEQRINLPVEVWQRGSQWTFNVSTTSEIKEVVLDPDRKLPEWNRDNNSWKKKAF